MVWVLTKIHVTYIGKNQVEVRYLIEDYEVDGLQDGLGLYNDLCNLD